MGDPPPAALRPHGPLRPRLDHRSPSEGTPAFHRFTHTESAAPADGFIDLSAWGTGLIWLNGFLLGHYDTPRGPQRTLYAPAPLWHTGPNEILLLELERPGATLPLRDRPDLGRPTVFTPEL